MRVLPEALQPLAEYPQFILWTTAIRNDKLVKLPVDYRSASVADAHNPEVWTTADRALSTAQMFGDEYGVGFVFTKDDPFFFVDLDKCLNPDGVTWSTVAMDVMSRLPGAAIEVSQSGIGLHIFGKGVSPDHGCKNIPLGLEFYTEGRFVALTGTNAIGDAGLDCTQLLPNLVTSYFPLSGAPIADVEWSAVAVPEWTGSTDDDELIQKAKDSKSAGSIFQGRSSFAALWDGDEDELSKSYHDEGSRAYDASSADAALAQHLAFWTGNNCERILALMKRSGLVRDKWEREDYLRRTITRAVSLQETVYSIQQVDTTIVDQYGAVKLRGSEAQCKFAENIRAIKIAECGTDKDLAVSLAKIQAAKFWIDNKDITALEIKAKITTIESAANPMGCVASGPTILSGYQYLGATQQVEYFKGCVYIQESNRVLTPTGALLKPDQFNATYGGYSFQLDDGGDKVTRKAWEAFNESQIVRYPKAESTCFRPSMEFGKLIKHEDKILVNTYMPVDTESIEGDVTPFLIHLSKILPNEKDRIILTSFMAACIQYKGTKFQWAPLLQGAEGNGKTLFTRCVSFAIGERYTHLPPANEIAEKFNAWLFDKLFIGVEDVYVPDHKKEVIEVLKPMITNDRLAKRAMQQDQVTQSICANFMLNSNHKDGIRKTRTDRRFAVFYTAQQDDQDIIRDSMDGAYFPDLYSWLRGGGYAKVSYYLSHYKIPEEYNPATKCHRAPETSSTHEAITSSLGGIEQDIIEAIEEGRIGFAGGWISSVAVERLLMNIRATRAIPHNKRRDLLKSLGYDWHPALAHGRVNNPIAIDDNKKPKLFIKEGHADSRLVTSAEATHAYLEAQGVASTGNAADVFKK